MSSKEKKGFKQISKKFLSSFRREKKLHDISEIQEDQTEKHSGHNLSQNNISFSADQSARTSQKEIIRNENTQKKYALTLSPHKPNKSHFKRILNRASFSNVRSIVKEHPDLLRNINSPIVSQFDLGESRSASTDSGIDCSILVSEKGSPEKFVAFSRREAERLRQEFLNESTLETVTEVDSRSSVEDDKEGEASKIEGNASNINIEADESLEDQINQTKEQIEVLTELKTVLSGKLKEFDNVQSESPLLDDENYVVMTPPASNTSKPRSNKYRTEDGALNTSHVDGYFLDMYSNKTDEIKAKETKIRPETNSYYTVTDHQIIDCNIDHRIVNPVPVVSADLASHKVLPSTPARVNIVTHENSAFAKSKTVRRSVSDVGKGLLGKLKSKKKEQVVNLMSKDDIMTVDTRKKLRKVKAKSLKKNRSFSFDGEHNISLDYLNCSDVNFKLLDDHTSIVEDIDSIQPIVESGKNAMKKKSPVLKEIVSVERKQSPVPTSFTEMTNSICEMTSALCHSQHNSAESIACICDCKNRNSNNDCCEIQRRTSPDLAVNGNAKAVKVVQESTFVTKNQNKDGKKDPKVTESTFDNKRVERKLNKDDPEILNKTIRDLDEKNESLYVNLVKTPLDKTEKKWNQTSVSVTNGKVNVSYLQSGCVETMIASSSDTDDCDCCDWCSQGCDCSHSDTQCSDPNCSDCNAELDRRREYGNISSSCDSLSENDGLQLDKSVMKPYPNWVNSGDEQSTSSSMRSSPNAQISTSKLSTSNRHTDKDEPSPEPVRITKFDSSPNSINSFNMDSSFSVSFREVDFENGEVMYKLDNGLNESILSNEHQESPALRKSTLREKQHPYSCTPALSPSEMQHDQQRSINTQKNSDKQLRKHALLKASDQMNLSLPMNRNFSKQHDQTVEDPYVLLGMNQSPLNLTYNEGYNIHVLKKPNSNQTAVRNDFMGGRSSQGSRNGRNRRPDFQGSRKSAMSQSLNESQFLYDHVSPNTNSDVKKSRSFNHPQNNPMLHYDDRPDHVFPTGSLSRYTGSRRSLPPSQRMSRSFSEISDLNQTALNESCIMDSSMLNMNNSPLDLSMSKPRQHKEASPRPLDLSMSRITSPVDRRNKQSKWVNRHVGQIYSPAKRVLHKNQGLSEKDLCKQILDLYVSDADESVFEPPSAFDTTMDDSMMTTGVGGINVEDSILQYGTYLAPRNVVKETNVDDFTTTVRTCYTGEAKTRKLPADGYTIKHVETVEKEPERHRKGKMKSERHRSGRKDRHVDLNSSRMKENMHEALPSLNQSAEHIYEEIPSFHEQKSILKDRTNTLKKRSSLKQKSKSGEHEGMDKESKKNRKEMKEMSDSSFDRLTMLHTAHNGKRKVKCLSMDESIHVVKHYPPPKEATRISWGQNLSEMELWRHTPRKSPLKTTPILTQKENTYPYEDDNPSPIVLTKMRKPKTFNQKYKNWPWS